MFGHYVYVMIMSDLSLSHGFKQLFIVDWIIILLRLDLKRWSFVLKFVVKLWVHKIIESDHKLIGQIGARSVGGIRAGATGLIIPNHYSSRFRFSISNLIHQFDKSQLLTTPSLGQSLRWVRDVPRGQRLAIFIRLGLCEWGGGFWAKWG